MNLVVEVVGALLSFLATMVARLALCGMAAKGALHDELPPFVRRAPPWPLHAAVVEADHNPAAVEPRWTRPVIEHHICAQKAAGTLWRESLRTGTPKKRVPVQRVPGGQNKAGRKKIGPGRTTKMAKMESESVHTGTPKKMKPRKLCTGTKQFASIGFTK